MTGSLPAGSLLLLSTAVTAGMISYLLFSVNRLQLLEMITSPDAILVLIAINGVVGVIRVVAAGEAWHRAGGRFLGVGLFLLLIFTAVPHLAVGYVGLETRATILTVFAPENPVVVATTTTSAPDPTTTTIEQRSSPLVPRRAIPTSSTSSSTTTTTIPLGQERASFLLLGTDAGPGRAGIRTDAIMVATVNTLTGDAALFGLPRNMAGFKFSDGTEFEGFTRGILNEVYMWGNQNPQRFPGQDPGVAAVKDVAETLLGLPIDHFVLVDMAGFAQLVDVFGGVDVTISQPMMAPLYDRTTGEHQTVRFAPGIQRLDGDHALAFARTRTGSNDYLRMARQRCLVSGLVDQAGPLTLTPRLPALLNVIESSVSTDIPINDLPYLINLAPKITREATVVVGFDSEYRSGELTEKGYAIPDLEKIQTLVRSVLAGETESSTALSTAADSCG